MNIRLKYNIVDSLPMVSPKQTIEQPEIGKLQLNVNNPDMVLIYMNSSKDMQSSYIAVDRTNIDRLIESLRWAKLNQGDFFFHAKRYFRKTHRLKDELWPRSKYEIQVIQQEFEDWCMDNEAKIRRRIARDKAESVSGIGTNSDTK